ncbi:MAG: cob(I)yrinic acid a,c-diamide adenosyltransferase [Tannerella sp.]|jgi:cob(I)alamin adenosyltransferase|nr:cob(I)yrinic acid a,c-diamide adenosyltransferase [Tannerella sp.]
MKKSNVYTRTGDAGMTSLVGGARVPKTHPRLEAYGTIDELNSFIGLLVAEMTDAPTLRRTSETNILQSLSVIQSKLFDIGAYLATDPEQTSFTPAAAVTDEDIKYLEEAIDLIDDKLPKMKSFVIPGGCKTAALIHVCRTVCRRAERAMFAIETPNSLNGSSLPITYINRLSDYLFVMARYECISNTGSEVFL